MLACRFLFRVRKQWNGRIWTVICLQGSTGGAGLVRRRRCENVCGASVLCDLSLFLSCLLEEGLDSAGLFAAGVMFQLRGWLRGGLLGGEHALGWRDVAGKKFSDPTCWWSVAEFASWKVQHGERGSPGNTIQKAVTNHTGFVKQMIHSVIVIYCNYHAAWWVPAVFRLLMMAKLSLDSLVAS